MILSYGKLLGQVFTIFSSRQCCLATMLSGENLHRSSLRITDIWWRSSSRMIMRYCSIFNLTTFLWKLQNSNFINLATFLSESIYFFNLTIFAYSINSPWRQSRCNCSRCQHWHTTWLRIMTSWPVFSGLSCRSVNANEMTAESWNSNGVWTVATFKGPCTSWMISSTCWLLVLPMKLANQV